LGSYSKSKILSYPKKSKCDYFATNKNSRSDAPALKRTNKMRLFYDFNSISPASQRPRWEAIVVK